MSSSHSNVVQLFPAAPTRTDAAERQRREIEQDLRDLRELATQLSAAKRQFLLAATAYEASRVAADVRGGEVDASEILDQVERLEAGIHGLVGAMTTFRASAPPAPDRPNRAALPKM